MKPNISSDNLMVPLLSFSPPPPPTHSQPLSPMLHSPSNWPLLGHILDTPKNTTNKIQQHVHSGYRGVDVKFQYSLENDSSVIFCDTYTHGSSEVFVLVNSVRPTVLLPKQRFSLPLDGIPTFIRSSCMTNIKQSGRGAIIAYTYKYEPEWKMAVVNSFRYDLGHLHSIDLWEFRNVVDQNGVPTILKCDQWESMLPLLRLRSFVLDHIELLFLNQVSLTTNNSFVDYQCCSQFS